MSVLNAVLAEISSEKAQILLAGILAAGVFVLIALLLKRRIDAVFAGLKNQFSLLEDRFDHTEAVVKDEIARNRQETALNSMRAREELAASLHSTVDALLKRISESAAMQKNQLDSFARQLADLTGLNETKLENMRKTVDVHLKTLQEDNSRRLEQMRAVVDEKLQSTLEKRLGESFKQVSERLEQVYTGLGEMRSLAAGVGDLKKVLTNVKTRGTWGEIQLGNILEQLLTPEQYDVNVATRKNSSERVEYAIRLPGPHQDRDRIVWLPIDSKFPQEDYQRLLDAQEAADREQAEKCIKSLELRIRTEAKGIRAKYLDPPHTTDFGIMFLPVEGLYAEVLRRPGLCDLLQREYRIVVTGPTTLAALLNSLQMGFRTLAIEKRSSEVWELLGIVKTEFGKFGDILSKTKKKLQEASNTIDQAEVRTRAIERKLKKVQEASPYDSALLIEEAEPEGENPDPEEPDTA